jgi:tetratricopeptide (TPR) repeat protein
LAYLYVGFLDAKISNASDLISNKLTTFAKLIQKIGHISNYDCDIVTAKRLYQIALDSYSCNLQSEEFPISHQASIQFGHFNLLMGVHAHHKNQDLDELIEIGESTVKILRSVNDKSQLYRVLSHIAAVNLWKGNLTSAESLFLEAVEIERSLGHKESVARDLGNLGILYEKQGRIKLAIEYHEKALSINSKLANDRDMLLDHQRLAFCNLNLGNIANSLRHLNMVLELHKWRPEINRSWILSFLDSYSIALIGSGNSKEALTVVDHLISDISELIKAGYDIEPHEAKCMISGLLSMARILYAQNDKDGAIECISAASSTAIVAQLLEEYLRVNLHMITMLDEMNGPNSSISLASELLSTINQSDRQNLSDELVSIQNQLLSYLSSARPDNLGGV